VQQWLGKPQFFLSPLPTVIRANAGESDFAAYICQKNDICIYFDTV